MSVIYLLLALSILVAIIFFIAFVVSVKSGQYDDLDKPGYQILADKEEIIKDEEKGKDNS